MEIQASGIHVVYTRVSDSRTSKKEDLGVRPVPEAKHRIDLEKWDDCVSQFNDTYDIEIPEAPPDVDVSEELKNNLLISFVLGFVAQRFDGPLQGLGEFVNPHFASWIGRLLPGRAWDYKSQYPDDLDKYADFGNFNFGVVSYAFGNSASFSVLGAHAASLAFDWYPDPDGDQEQIANGWLFAGFMFDCMKAPGGSGGGGGGGGGSGGW